MTRTYDNDIHIAYIFDAKTKNLKSKFPSNTKAQNEWVARAKVDKKELNELLTVMIPYVWNIVTPFQKKQRGTTIEDYISVGVEAMMKAVDAFDPTRGVNFMWFAKKYIITAIMNHGSTFSSIKTMMVTNSYDSELNDVPMHQYEEKETHDDNVQQVQYYLSILTPRERAVLEQAFGLNGKVRCQEHRDTLARLNMSHQAYHSIRQRALRKIRDHVGKKREMRNVPSYITKSIRDKTYTVSVYVGRGKTRIRKRGFKTVDAAIEYYNEQMDEYRKKKSQ